MTIKEKELTKHMQYYYANHEKRKQSMREYHHRNREKRCQYKREWYQKNKEKVAEYQRKKIWDLKVGTLIHYGGRCDCCGETEIKFLCIDHINGGGNKHQKEIKMNMYYWLRNNNYPPGFRVLCYNCNMATGFYGSCPHKGEVS